MLSRAQPHAATQRGRSPLEVGGIAEQTRDVRAAVLGALEHDRQEGPVSQMQLALLDGYLAATATNGGGQKLGGGSAAPAGVTSGGGGGGGGAGSRDEMRALLAERAAARRGDGGSGAGTGAPPGPES